MSRDQYRAMQVITVPVDSTGSVLRLTLKNRGSALDLSSATGDVLYNAKTRSETAVATDATAAFTTDGSDGQIDITLTSALVGTVRDLIMDVEVQGYSGGNLVAWSFILRVIPRAKGA